SRISRCTADTFAEVSSSSNDCTAGVVTRPPQDVGHASRKPHDLLVIRDRPRPHALGSGLRIDLPPLNENLAAVVVKPDSWTVPVSGRRIDANEPQPHGAPPDSHGHGSDLHELA